MPNSGGVKPLWQRLYEQAAAETDREKLTDIINRIEGAMIARAQEIAHSPNHWEERNAIAQASENLLIIKTEKLKWPPVEMN
jgi:hypothetical protein